MIVLDENVSDEQRLVLRSWRIRAHKIGRDLGTKGTADAQLIGLLLSLRRPTFFTRDDDFLDRQFWHQNYCLVFLSVPERATAEYVRRVLRHPALNTQAKRMGAVVRASDTGIRVWRRHQAEQAFPWP